MNYLNSLSIAKRLGLSIGSVLLLLLIAVAGGIYGLESVYKASTSTMDGDVRRAQSAANLRILILTARRFEKDAFINMDVPEVHASYRKEWEANRAQLDAEILVARALSRSDEDQRAVDVVAAGAREYAVGFEATLALLDKGQLGTAEDANRAFNKYEGSVHAMESASAKLNDKAVKAVEAVRAPLADQFHRTLTIQLALAISSFLVACGLGFVISRSVVLQLGGEPSEVVKIANSIADGNLTIQVAVASGDNQSVMAAMSRMRSSLARLAGLVRSSTDNIAVASSQIAQGNQDLSARTEAQASALEETAASMEELSSNVRLNAESARQANRLSHSAVEIATAGGAVVAEVVETMRHINESSGKIFDIISVIDGIAFQTNILALNAAVEAARAGEQGRGFAVVASEVRSLAGRSAEAAKEVKNLISTSVERVEQGDLLVTRAGSTMTEVISSIRRVTDIIDGITSNSSEQSESVSQISKAVSQMDQATQQNSALVEEMAGAAGGLKGQSDALVDTVSVFKI